MVLLVTASPRYGACLPLVSQIRLVAHKHDDHVTAPLCPDVINPFRSLLEGVEIWRQKVGTEWGIRPLRGQKASRSPAL